MKYEEDLNPPLLLLCSNHLDAGGRYRLRGLMPRSRINLR
jgi:hypothetical protein